MSRRGITPTKRIIFRPGQSSLRIPFQHRVYSSSQRPSSVSAEEISHFNALASTWWDSYGSSRLLHLMNPLRHDFIRSCHASQRDTLPDHASMKYLDIGCGGGIFAESAARLPHVRSVTAIDPSPEVLAIARAHARRDPALTAKLTYLNTSIEGLPLLETKSAQYDVVTIFEVIEHVTNPSIFLDQVVEQLKPGGWLVMSTIARHWISYLTTKVIAEDFVGIVPRGTHDWRKYLNEEELRGWFGRRGGFDSPKCIGVVYVPGVGWRAVNGSKNIGNYFLGVRKHG